MPWERCGNSHIRLSWRTAGIRARQPAPSVRPGDGRPVMYTISTAATTGPWAGRCCGSPAAITTPTRALEEATPVWAGSSSRWWRCICSGCSSTSFSRHPPRGRGENLTAVKDFLYNPLMLLHHRRELASGNSITSARTAMSYSANLGAPSAFHFHDAAPPRGAGAPSASTSASARGLLLLLASLVTNASLLFRLRGRPCLTARRKLEIEREKAERPATNICCSNSS